MNSQLIRRTQIRPAGVVNILNPARCAKKHANVLRTLTLKQTSINRLKFEFYNNFSFFFFNLNRKDMLAE